MICFIDTVETIINGSDIMIIYLSQSILQLYQTYKNV